MKLLTAKEIERIVLAKGWYFVRMNGSHAHYKHPTLPGFVTIPFHGSRSLPPGTQRSIMRTAGITHDDL